MKKKIVQIEPWIDNDELEQLKRVVESTYLVEHTLTKEFEGLTQQLTKSKHVIAITNGTMALYCGLKALGIKEGDQVIVPNLTFIATANSVLMAGATPVFCDVYPDTFCIDIEKAESLINEKTKAIMPVHLYGQAADMEKIMDLAAKRKLLVIEDAAQGVGVKFNGQHVGTFGDVGILSYYGNKTITCGEGGVILTNNDLIASKCYKLKNHGREGKGVFVHDSIGFNFSFTEMQAAIGIAQMNKLDRIIEKKLEIYRTYNYAFKNIELLTPVHIDKRCNPVFWFTSFLTSNVNDLTNFLFEHGIQTRRFFYPLNLQPCYSNFDYLKKDFPISSLVYEQGISLPSSYNLSREDQHFVIEKILEFNENWNKSSKYKL